MCCWTQEDRHFSGGGGDSAFDYFGFWSKGRLSAVATLTSGLSAVADSTFGLSAVAASAFDFWSVCSY